MQTIMQTDHLVKQYGSFTAVNGVSLQVQKGDIYGLIGRNGAGKSTLLKMLSGLAHPTQGTVSFYGGEAARQAYAFSRVGVLIEQPGLYLGLTAEQNLKIKMLALGVRKKDYAQQLLHTVGLADAGSKKVKKFSLGMKQRLGIALALVGDPDLLILDEPINGLDPQGIAEVRDTLLQLNQKQHITLIISSHILVELSKIATRYGILHHGELLQQITHEELLARCSERMEVQTDDARRACTVLEGMGITQYKVDGNDTLCIFERLTDSGAIAAALENSGVKVRSITVKNEELENYFLRLTGGESHV